MLTIILILIALVAAAFLVRASADMSTGVYLKAFCKARLGRRTVYLTFDDGPEPGCTERVLDVLKRRGAVATFFVIGSRVHGNEAVVRRAVEEGHRIGLHSYCHSSTFPLFRDGRMKADLESCASVLEDAAGVSTDIFRPPFGVVNPVVARTVRSLGLKTVGWSIRTFDTSLIARENGQERILKRISRRLDDGAVILLHDRLPHSDELLEKILDMLDNAGLRYDVPLEL